MATLKITSSGNSAGLILPKELLEELRVGKGDSVHVTETPRGLELSAYNDQISRQMEVAERIMRDNRNLLKKLAE